MLKCLHIWITKTFILRYKYVHAWIHINKPNERGPIASFKETLLLAVYVWYLCCISYFQHEPIVFTLSTWNLDQKIKFLEMSCDQFEIEMWNFYLVTFSCKITLKRFYVVNIIDRIWAVAVIYNKLMKFWTFQQIFMVINHGYIMLPYKH